MSSQNNNQPAIPGETVANIRKYLNKTQLLFDNRHRSQSFDLNTDIGQTGKSYSIQQFCFDFVRGNQGKRRARHSKNKAKC